ncbi:MAG: phage holin family protein [Anaerolineae bacterium]
MTRFIIRLLINALALGIAAQLVGPGISYDGWQAVLIVAFIFGLVNAVIRPILTLLTCPLIILTLGIFTLVINALMLLLAGNIAEALGIGFRVDGFGPAFFGGLIISIVSFFLSVFVRDDAEQTRAA